MKLPQRATANPRGQSRVGRSPVMLGERKGKLAAELRSFARRAASPAVVNTAPRTPGLRRQRPATSGPFNPNARIGPNTSVRMAQPIKANAVPRPGDLRSAAVSLSRGRLPQGSLLSNIADAIGGAVRTTAPVIVPGTAAATASNLDGALREYNAQRQSAGQRVFDYPGRRGFLPRPGRSMRRLPR